MMVITFLIALVLAIAVFLILYKPVVCGLSNFINKKLEEQRKKEEDRKLERERLLNELRKQQEEARAERLKRDEQRQIEIRDAKLKKLEEQRKKASTEIITKNVKKK